MHTTAGATPFQVTITKTYNATNLLEDIRGLYKLAALKGQKVAFIFTYVAACIIVAGCDDRPTPLTPCTIHRDAEVKDVGFLEYINQLLMTGEVTNLFPKDEMDMLLNDLRPIMKCETPGESPESLLMNWPGRPTRAKAQECRTPRTTCTASCSPGSRIACT